MQAYFVFTQSNNVFGVKNIIFTMMRLHAAASTAGSSCAARSSGPLDRAYLPDCWSWILSGTGSPLKKGIQLQTVNILETLSAKF